MTTLFSRLFGGFLSRPATKLFGPVVGWIATFLTYAVCAAVLLAVTYYAADTRARAEQRRDDLAEFEAIRKQERAEAELDLQARLQEAWDAVEQDRIIDDDTLRNLRLREGLLSDALARSKVSRRVCWDAKTVRELLK